MERYYVPAPFSITDNSLFSVRWLDNGYMVFNGCPDRTGPIALDYISVTPWGFTTDIGTSSINSSDKLLVGESCDPSEFDIATISVSRSILDAPNFSPYEPLYFLALLTFSIFFIAFAFKLIFGKGWH